MNTHTHTYLPDFGCRSNNKHPLIPAAVSEKICNINIMKAKPIDINSAYCDIIKQKMKFTLEEINAFNYL
jgi:hypothetical protein